MAVTINGKTLMQDTWKQKLRPLYQNTPIFDAVMGRRSQYQLAEWLKANKATPAPHIVKERALIEHAERYLPRILVETGTFRGDMLYFLRNRFQTLFSIELQPEYYQRAVRRFRKYPQIRLVQGDSGERLGKVIGEIREPCLFWLDGHFSGSSTAQSVRDTPIVEELTAIAAHPVKTHVILIDDAECFDGSHDYPTIEGVRLMVKERFPNHSFEVRDSIIRILPPV